MRKPHRAPARQAGFTLLEMIVVLVIIGLIMGLVGPRLFGQAEKAKVDTAETQIKMLGGALQTMRLDIGRLPTREEGLQLLMNRPADPKLSRKWAGPYLEDALPEDPWGRPYLYASPGQHGETDVWTLGADAREGGEGANADVASWQ